MFRVIKGLAATIAVMMYPAIIYLFLSNNIPWLGLTLVLVVLAWKFRHQKHWQLKTAAVPVVLVLLILLVGPAVVSKLVPSIIHLLLFSVFYRSLNAVPLIEQFARLDFEEIPSEVLVYCRNLTKVWAGFFALNALVCVLLSIWGDDRSWAVYNGLVIYLLIGVLIVGEYIWRHIRFPNLEIPSIQQTARNMMKNGHKVWGAN